MVDGWAVFCATKCASCACVLVGSSQTHAGSTGSAFLLFSRHPGRGHGLLKQLAASLARREATGDTHGIAAGHLALGGGAAAKADSTSSPSFCLSPSAVVWRAHTAKRVCHTSRYETRGLSRYEHSMW